MATQLLVGESGSFELPDVRENTHGEYPLPEQQLAEIEGFPEIVREILGVDEKTQKSRRNLPLTDHSKIIALAFENREDALVHSILYERPHTTPGSIWGDLDFDIPRTTKMAITIVTYKDGSPARGKRHYYRRSDSLHEGVAHRPNSRDTERIKNLRDALLNMRQFESD